MPGRLGGREGRRLRVGQGRSPRLRSDGEGGIVQESLGCPSHFTPRPGPCASRAYAGAVGNPAGLWARKAGPQTQLRSPPPPPLRAAEPHSRVLGPRAATAGPAPSAALFGDLHRSTTSRKRRRAAPHLPAFISQGRN